MRRYLRALVLLACLGGAILPCPLSPAAAAQPAYAKWGVIAMQQVKARYDADIVDYLHVGRTEVGPGIAEERFKLWLRDRNREFGVYVTIRFYTATEQIITIRLQETAN